MDKWKKETRNAKRGSKTGCIQVNEKQYLKIKALYIITEKTNRTFSALMH